jgi:predicted DNA-binding protein (MmcQ/YjbR family)
VTVDTVRRICRIPAPYLARAMWVQEREIGAALERPELERLIKSSYELVAAKLPKSKRPGASRGAPRRPRKMARRA